MEKMPKRANMLTDLDMLMEDMLYVEMRRVVLLDEGDGECCLNVT